MKKAISSISILCFLCTNIIAQTAANTQTLLWKISGNGLQQESYVLLTTNTCDSKVVLSEKIKSTLGKVKQIVTQSASTNKANKNMFEVLAVLKNDSASAQKMLSNNLYEQVKKQAEAAGINSSYLNAYSMFYIHNFLFSTLGICSLPSNERVKIEDELRSFARKNNMGVKELLTFQESLALYDKYPKPYWENIISLFMNHPEKISFAVTTRAAYYKQENYSGIKQLYVKNEYLGNRYLFKNLEQNRIALLYNRIENELKSTPSLFLLDVAEVVNDSTSLFNVFIKQGYIISPIID